uniref:Aminotransferase-like plant mobile domain-containing protein n=1 Tax=Setaria italica TaxID=4555 RepID=K3XS99_SETIT
MSQFEGPPSFTDLVDRTMRKYGCRVDEMSLRGRFDCGKARAHYVLMNLASDSNWKHMDEVAVVNRNGTQESENLQHVLGETKSSFDLAIANDDFLNNTFERDEANIDDDDVSRGFEDSEFEEDGIDAELPSIPNDKDISMVHKAICESSMVNFEGIPFSESPVIKKGMKFKSLEELKFFLADYAVRLHRPFSVVHSDKNLRYNCTAKYLGRCILGIICKDSETLVPSLMESIFAFSGYHVKYSTASRAKQHAVALLWWDWKESYGMVPRVLTAMAYYNPGVKWFIDSCGMMHSDNGVLKHILQRVFWCFPQCSEAFQHCRPVILVDGTFMTGKYKATQLMAVGVESENNESWSWFMKLVRRHVLGPLQQVWCTRHFAANMSHRQKTNRVIGKLKTLCKIHTKIEFSEKLEDLVKDLNDDAKEWLKGEMEDRDKWAQAFVEGGMRWGIMTTNYSESLNVVFKGIQSRPVSGIIEYSFKKCNAYFVDRWQKARAMLDEGHRIGKVADEFLSQAELRSVHQLAEPYGPEMMVYSIRSCGTTNIGGESHGGRHYIVDLNNVSCTCNIPQLLHLPLPLYISPLYSREHTVRIWESSFQPYLDSSQWLAYEGVGYVPNPNLMRNKVGRRMPALAYPLLEATYDLQHRAYHLADLHEDLKPLRARVHSPFRWDECYAQYLQRVGFLDIAVQVVAGVPPMDRPLSTTMVDRWRPETHTFHLPFGEMTIMMQDIAMILGLPLEGHPVMGIIQNENWCDMVAMHSGIRPLELEDGDNSKKTSGPIRGNPDRRYKAYTNELDVVTQHQVEWKPYNRQQLRQIVFSLMCYRDKELWRCTTPMMLYYVVEFHMPHRVMWQFGRMQPCPPLELSTSEELHRIGRRKRYKENDWRVKHAQYLIQWENRKRCDLEGGSYWRVGPNNEYIRWYCASMRTKVKPSWSNVPIEDAPSDSSDDIADVSDKVTHYGTQPERAPLHDY